MAGKDDITRAIRAALDRERPATLAEAQAVVDRLQAEHNRRPLNEFDGLSPAQMTALLYSPLESPEVVSFAEAVPADTRAPILNLYGRIADAIGERGLKGTAKGNLPRKLVREAAFAYFPEDANLERHVFKEEDFFHLHSVRRMAELAGLIRKRHGKFLLTVKGRKLHGAGAAGAYPALFETYTRRFNWGFQDGFPEIPIVQTAALFSLRLLARYGAEPRPESFYADRFIRAFPMAVEEAAETSWRSAEDQVRDCFALRTFRYLELLGLAERLDDDERSDLRPNRLNIRVRKRPLLDAWARFRV